MSQPARADLWACPDAGGATRFAAERLDARCELFWRGSGSFDTAERDASAGAARPVGVPTSATKLLAYFEVAPGYKSVKHHLRAASQAHGIDYELLKALIATESGFNSGAVSPKGAVGLMQVMPATAERYGLSADARRTVEQKLADPATNIRTGARYFGYLLKLFPGRTDLALAAYNAGEGAVQRAGNRVPAYRETENYVRTVMQLYTLLKPPAAVLSARSGRVRMELGGRAALPQQPAPTAPMAPATPSAPLASPAPAAPITSAAPLLNERPADA